MGNVFMSLKNLIVQTDYVTEFGSSCQFVLYLHGNTVYIKWMFPALGPERKIKS